MVGSKLSNMIAKVQKVFGFTSGNPAKTSNYCKKTGQVVMTVIVMTVIKDFEVGRGKYAL